VRRSAAARKSGSADLNRPRNTRSIEHTDTLRQAYLKTGYFVIDGALDMPAEAAPAPTASDASAC